MFCGFVPRYPHVYIHTYCTGSPVWPVALPVWRLPAAEFCRAVPGLVFPQVFFKPIACVCKPGFAIVTITPSLFGISYFKWLFLLFSSFSMMHHFGYSVCCDSSLLLIAVVQNLLIMQIVHVSFKASKYTSCFIDVERPGKGLIFFFFSITTEHWQIWSYFTDSDTKKTTYKGIKFLSGWFSVRPSTLTTCTVIYLFSVINCSQSLNIS